MITRCRSKWRTLAKPGTFSARVSRLRGNIGPASLATFERMAVEEALAATGGNKREAARILQISSSTLYRKMAEYGNLATASESRSASQ